MTHTPPAFRAGVPSHIYTTPTRLPLGGRGGVCVVSSGHFIPSLNLHTLIAALSVVLLVTGQRGCEWKSTEAAAVLGNNRAASGKHSKFHSVRGEQPRL